MFTFRSVLDRIVTLQEKKIHRVLYTWRLGLIEYYMCCLCCLRYVWCVRREGGVVVGTRWLLRWLVVGRRAPWSCDASGPIRDKHK